LKKANERKQLLQSKGFGVPIIINEDGMSKIQVGYFDGKENAEKLLKKLQAKKIDAFIKEI